MAVNMLYSHHQHAGGVSSAHLCQHFLLPAFRIAAIQEGTEWARAAVSPCTAIFASPFVHLHCTDGAERFFTCQLDIHMYFS